MSAPTIPKTMRAVVLKAPFDVKVETIPVPTIQDDTDVLVKVLQAGLCGGSPSPSLEYSHLKLMS